MVSRTGNSKKVQCLGQSKTVNIGGNKRNHTAAELYFINAIKVMASVQE